MSGHISNASFQCFGNIEFIGINSNNIKSFHTITDCCLLEIDTTDHITTGKTYLEEKTFIVDNLHKLLPITKVLGKLTFAKFSKQFSIRKLQKGEIFQYKNKRINKVYLIIEGECSKLIFTNP